MTFGEVAAIYLKTSGWILAVVFLAVFIRRLLIDTIPHDDSDPPGGRSGVTVVTDALTGCQYLKTPKGGITPRLAANGKPICVAPETSRRP